MLQNIKNRHLTHAFTSAHLNDFVKKILPLVAKISNKFDFSLAYSYLCSKKQKRGNQWQ